MSTEYHAAAVVGCKVDKTKIFFTEKVRACDHPLSLDNEFAKFCPECGVPVVCEKERAIPQYDWRDKGTVCGFTVFNNECDDFVIIAEEFTETDYDWRSKMININTIATTKLKLRAALGACGLWKENQFGIHVVIWCN